MSDHYPVKHSARVSIDGGDIPTPSSRLSTVPAMLPPPHRGFGASSQTYLPSVLRLLAEPLRRLFGNDMYRAYTKERCDFENYPDGYGEDNIQPLLDLPLEFGNALQECWQRGAAPVVVDKLTGLVDSLPSIQNQSIGAFVESLLESLAMTLMPTTRRTGAFAATMSQVPQSQVTAHRQHAASPLASLFAGLYCETSTCSKCQHNDAVFKTVVVLTLKTHAYEMDVQERFARLVITPHRCSFGAELTHDQAALASPARNGQTHLLMVACMTSSDPSSFAFKSSLRFFSSLLPFSLRKLVCSSHSYHSGRKSFLLLLIFTPDVCL